VSFNPLVHIDPFGTVVLPLMLLMLGVLAALFIGALPLMGPPKEQSSAFALRFSPAPPAWISTR
jgi:hypothetical protein